MPSKLSRTTTDHEEIRRWAEARGAEPAEVEGTERGGDDVGIIRLDFPGYTGTPPLRHISWDEWFEKFDDSGLALVYQERTSGGQQSNFNKLVARETAEARSRGERGASRRSVRSRRGTRAGARGARPAARRARGGRRSAAGRSRGAGTRRTGSSRRRGGARSGRIEARSGRTVGRVTGKARTRKASSGRRRSSGRAGGRRTPRRGR